MLAISKSLKNELRFIIFDEPPPGWDAAAVLENGTVVLTGGLWRAWERRVRTCTPSALLLLDVDLHDS
jgi:hypothetical protein